MFCLLCSVRSRNITAHHRLSLDAVGAALRHLVEPEVMLTRGVEERGRRRRDSDVDYRRRDVEAKRHWRGRNHGKAPTQGCLHEKAHPRNHARMFVKECSPEIDHPRLFTRDCSHETVHTRLFTRDCSHAIVYTRLFTRDCSHDVHRSHARTTAEFYMLRRCIKTLA